MSIGSMVRCTVIIAYWAVWATGCMTYPTVNVDNKKVQLATAETEYPESELLDIRIEILEPGSLPTSANESRGLSTEIREAESSYMAVELKNAIQRTGYWGAVRVVPSASSGDEVIVTGKIVKSNGEEVKLEIGVKDATGVHWFRKSYSGLSSSKPRRKTFKSAVDVKMYEQASEHGIDVFQNIYNDIANKLIAYRRTLPPGRTRQIRQVAELQFAKELAPSAFTGYLKRNNVTGFTTIDRLPSDDSDILDRVRRVRERDYMLVDTLDAHYDEFHRKMRQNYTDWRKARLEEINIIRDVDKRKNDERIRAALLVGAAVGVGVIANNQSSVGTANPGTASAIGAAVGVAATMAMQAEEIKKEAEINKLALEELGESFSIDAEAIVVEVEGKTVELTGSAEAKYQQWHEILERLYEVETGFKSE